MVPGLGRHHRGGEVEFLQGRAVREVGTDLVLQVVARLAHLVALEGAAVDDPVVHRRVQRVERGGQHEHLEAVAIAERQPLLAIVALAGPAHVAAVHAPGGVDVVEPERRGPGADGHVDEHGGVVAAQLLRHVQQGHEVRADAVAGAVPLERVDAALAHQLPATVHEPLLVLRVGEVEFPVRRDEPQLAGLRGAFLVAAIPAERRDPDAEVCAKRLHLGLGGREAARELALVLHPEALRRLVPAIVDEVGEHGDAALLHQLRVEGLHHLEHLGLIHAEAEVVPAVVVQEGAARAGALTLHVAEEGAAELARGGDARDGAEGVALFGVQGQAAGERAARPAGVHQVRRPRHLDPGEETGPGQRAAGARPDRAQLRQAQVGELHALQGERLGVGRGQLDRLAEVMRTIAQFGAPAGLHAARGEEVGLERLAVGELGEAHGADDVEGGGRQVARGEGREFRRDDPLAGGRREVEGAAAVADADQDEALTILPDHRDRRRPGERGVGAAIDPPREGEGALGPGKLADRRAVRRPFEAEAGLARRRRVQLEDPAFADRAGLPGMVLGLGLQVHLADPDELRFARELRAREGGDFLPALACLADAHDHPFLGEAEVDLVGAVARRGRRRGQAEELGAFLLDLTSIQFAGDRQREEVPAADLPGGADHLVLQPAGLAVDLGLGGSRGRTGEIDIRVGGLQADQGAKQEEQAHRVGWRDYRRAGGR